MQPRRSVAVLAYDGVSPFHLSVPQMVFGLAGVSGVKPRYDVVVCTEDPGELTLAGGLTLRVPMGLEALATADVIVAPSWDPEVEPSTALLGSLRAAHERGAQLIGLCLGSWLVAATGLVDGRTVSTHWASAVELAERFPAVHVAADVLWSDLGDIVTSAGVAAALDCCLHVVRQHHGSTYAAFVARAMVMAPHRVGSQAQYIPAPVTDAGEDTLAVAMGWAHDRLDEPIDLTAWARAGAMSRRTFTRRFSERIGLSPMRWLLLQRVDRARRLLESTNLPIDHVAARSGFGSPEALRYHFRRQLGVTPTEHRAQFGELEPA
ncbi:GlxA family transcriptional regulator [Nocardioides nematodiphilus]|uniref:GlxA family transcriptional regulator n=1 Tax=Nocardioides nematodiphilus TaxID=2849669 RepID=UPI001CD92013|nr:helix-turn-helix domain-containing protein [Nocardioides nematodiphilus]MCA1983415.1 helix-turn-helix domain-containing protein [Nocardioides nematodiphilus]